MSMDGSGSKVSGLMLAVDVGGTNTKYAVYDVEGNVFTNQEVRPTPQQSGDAGADRLEFADFICEVVGDAAAAVDLKPNDFDGIGVMVPALVDMKSGYIQWMPFLDVKDLDLKAYVYEKLGVNACVGPDVSVATLGAARELDLKEELGGTVLGVSAGTSIGLGVVVDTGDGFFRILKSPDLGFNTELFRAYGVAEAMGGYIPTPDHHMGWEIAARGIMNVLAERIEEVRETPLLTESNISKLKCMLEDDCEQLYRRVYDASDAGDVLSRKIIEQALDTDSGRKLVGKELHEAVAKRAVEVVDMVKDSPLYDLDLEYVSPKTIDDNARAGDLLSQEVLEHCGYLMGASLSVLIPFINPDTVVFFGGISRSDIWRTTAEKTVYENTSFDGRFLSKGQHTHFLGAVSMVDLLRTEKLKRITL